MTLKLTETEENILLLLNYFVKTPPDKYILPREISQKGLSRLTGIPKRNLVGKGRPLASLIGKDLVFQHPIRKHVKGGKRVVSTYFLTEDGIQKAESHMRLHKMGSVTLFHNNKSQKKKIQRDYIPVSA